MSKYLFLLLPVLIAGFTVSNLDTNHYGNNEDYDFVVNESRIFNSISDFVFLESAYPSPLSVGFPVNDFIYLNFNEWGGYSGLSFSLYERESLNQVSIDTSTFDSFTGTDLGLIPSDDLGITALKANTNYLLKMTNASGDYSEYYYEFTTGETETINPTVEDVRFENNDLAILFSETVKSWTLKEEGNIILEKDGIEFSPNFADLRTTAGYGWQNRNYFIEYPELVSGTYTLTVKNVRDASGNIMDDYSASIVKE
ncbi:MAG: hypothetical protein PHN56_04180 [Candidatus Nanoarchaeia archaeon]|nr:hypothetical protein [Candidatus Nanoarchaeia archaeon]